MSSFHGMGTFMSIIIYIVALLIAYLVIKAAVRNGIDESDVGRKMLGEQATERDTPRRNTFED